MYMNTLVRLKTVYHPYCIFNRNNIFNAMEFDAEGNLYLQFYCDKRFQGYTGRMHGGVLSPLLDSAITQCLMGHGIVAYTAKLKIRFLKPVKLNCNAVVKAFFFCILQNKFIEIQAEIKQEEEFKVKTSAVFRLEKRTTG